MFTKAAAAVGIFSALALFVSAQGAGEGKHHHDLHKGLQNRTDGHHHFHTTTSGHKAHAVMKNGKLADLHVYHPNGQKVKMTREIRTITRKAMGEQPDLFRAQSEGQGPTTLEVREFDQVAAQFIQERVVVYFFYDAIDRVWIHFYFPVFFVV